MVIASLPKEEISSGCSGVILSATEVLTAGHCAFDPVNQQLLPMGDMTVIAGVSNFDAPTRTDHAQAVSVASVNVHPDFDDQTDLPEPGDDVAVLHLAQPLVLSDAPDTTAEAIGLAPAGVSPTEGEAVNVYGFGLENPLDYATAFGATGPLNSLRMTLMYTPYCQTSDTSALFLCGTSPAGSVCESDSGGPVTTTTSPPLLVGIVSAFYATAGVGPCRANDSSQFTNLTAPEVQSFITGDSDPPLAPRGGPGISYTVPDVAAGTAPAVGQTMTCSAGTWSNNPTITYEFIADSTGIGAGADTASGVVRQSGASPDYTFSTADIGERIFCLVLAGNAGGTGSADTVETPAIAATPGTPASATAPTTPNDIVPVRVASTQPELRVVVPFPRVAPGGVVALRVILGDGAAALPRTRVCVTAPRNASLVIASGAKVHGRRACWSVRAPKGDFYGVPFFERVAEHAKAPLVTSASASDGLSARAAVYPAG